MGEATGASPLRHLLLPPSLSRRPCLPAAKATGRSPSGREPPGVTQQSASPVEAFAADAATTTTAAATHCRLPLHALCCHELRCFSDLPPTACFGREAGPYICPKPHETARSRNSGCGGSASFPHPRKWPPRRSGRRSLAFYTGVVIMMEIRVF